VSGQDKLPGDWYCFKQGQFFHSCRTREAAVEFCRAQIKAWRQSGAPRWPEYAVAYNRAGVALEIVTEETAVQS
jgi:hypothetical protein